MNMEISQEQAELLEAIEYGDLQRVKYLVVDKGVDANFGSSDYIEKNPICWASLNKRTNIAFWLVKEGGCRPSRDIFRFVTNVIGDISVSNLLADELGK